MPSDCPQMMRNQGQGPRMAETRQRQAIFPEMEPRPEMRGKAPAALLAVGLVLTLAVGLLDYFTGNEISFSMFYLLPTAYLAWRGGRVMGLSGAVVAAIAWFIVESLSGHTYSQSWIMYWNATVRLVFFVITAQLINKQKLVYTLEHKLSRTDNLTGLMNARSFFQDGEPVLALCARHARPLTVLYMDLDNFKQVNDSRGHQAGDRLIQLVGRGLLRAVRASDLAARLGGDEFGLLLPETGFAEAAVFIDRLRQSLDNEVDRAYWSVDYSVGVVTFPTPPADLEAATAMADKLMYEIKNSGKGRWLHRSADGGSAMNTPAPD